MRKICLFVWHQKRTTSCWAGGGGGGGENTTFGNILLKTTETIFRWQRGVNIILHNILWNGGFLLNTNPDEQFLNFKFNSKFLKFLKDNCGDNFNGEFMIYQKLLKNVGHIC